MHYHMEKSKVKQENGDRIEDLDALSDAQVDEFFYDDAYDLVNKIKNAHKYFESDKKEASLIDCNQNAVYRMSQLLKTYELLQCKECGKIIEKFPKYRKRVLSLTYCKKCIQKR